MCESFILPSVLALPPVILPSVLAVHEFSSHRIAGKGNGILAGQDRDQCDITPVRGRFAKIHRPLFDCSLCVEVRHELW